MHKTKAADPQGLWSPRVRTFKESGLSQAEYCRVNKYNVKQFNYWYRKLKNSQNTCEPEKPQWIAVDVGAVPSSNAFLAVKIGSATIEVKPGFNRQLLVEVVEALSKSC